MAVFLPAVAGTKVSGLDNCGSVRHCMTVSISEGLDVFSPSLSDDRIGVAELDHGVHHEAAAGAGGKHRLEPIEELVDVVEAASTMGELSVDLSGQAGQVVFESRVEQASLVLKGVVEAGPDDPG